MSIYKFLILSILFFVFHDSASAMKSKGDRWKTFESLFADRADDKRFAECLKKLLKWRDKKENSLLHHAVKNDDIEFVEGFIQMGLPINGMNAEGETPLDLAREAGHGEVYKLLYANAKLLFLDYSSSPFEALEEVLREGAYVDARDKYGYTPLLLSTQYLPFNADKIKCIAKLLEKGASVHAKTNAGATPLHHVVGHGCVEAVKLFLGVGANKNVRDGQGRTALAIALKYGHAEIVALLEDQPA